MNGPQASNGRYTWWYTCSEFYSLCTTTMTKLRTTDVLKLPDGFHADENGLYLYVRGNSRTWVYRGTLNGKRVKRGLGSARKRLTNAFDFVIDLVRNVQAIVFIPTH